MHALVVGATMRRATMVGVATLLMFSMACARTPASESERGAVPADLEAAAARMYEGYTSAIATPRREAIAGFYHPDGATRVINGVTSRPTRAALDRSYRGPWSPPAYFAWDTLAFDAIAPGEVLVTGLFRWQAAGQRDTVPWIYAAVLHSVDSGLAIVFEHETMRPTR